MKNFTFYNPTQIVFGKNTIPQIGQILNNDHISSILLLAGGGSIKNNGVYDTIAKSLAEYNIKFNEHFGVRPNPTVEHARIGRDIIAKNNLQAVLAVGGGSVIDEGKSIASGYYLDDIWNGFDKSVVPEKGLPIYTILTLSGTGSEANRNAVLSNDELKKKMSLYSELHFPKTSIIDPTVQYSLPWNQTANGGIDAMTHCMENYFTGTYQTTTPAVNEALMTTLIHTLDALQTEPNNYPHRANLAWAAVLALNGISAAGMNGGDWATHKLQHGISALYPHVAHSPGLTAIFPSWMKYCYKENPSQFNRWAKNVWQCNNFDDAINKMKNKFKQWGSPTSIRELDVPKNSIPDFVQNTLGIAHIIGGLKNLSADDIYAIYEMAW